MGCVRNQVLTYIKIRYLTSKGVPLPKIKMDASNFEYPTRGLTLALVLAWIQSVLPRLGKWGPASDK